MDYVGCFVEGFADGFCHDRWRWAVGGVCCEEGPADCVEGEDGEDEGDESPSGAEGGDDHGGGTLSPVGIP